MVSTRLHRSSLNWPMAILFALLASQSLFATEYNIDKEGVAIHGYDAVAYFTVGEAKKGDEQYSAVHGNVTYHFASAAHRDLFAADPTGYLPQYGGYCSYGVRLGKKFDIDPAAWAVVDGALYLQLNQGTQVIWKNDLQKNIEIAGRLWPAIRPIPAEQLAEAE
jgi:hypothetical protein